MNNNSYHLIIVESPSKAKTLKRFLGGAFHVEASVGHIRDLPKSDLGIDIENGFKPKYVVSPDKRKVISSLKKALESADTLYLATDPDREGEAIAWHLIQTLKPSVKIERLVFHEITKGAINKAFEQTRDIDQNLVSAQETRRIIDRLFGFQVSQKLWYNVKSKLSAGRVQSPAIKIIVDREKLRAAFIESEYWSLTGQFRGDGDEFPAILVQVGEQRVATGKDFDRTTGKLSAPNRLILNETSATQFGRDWKDHLFEVASVDQKPVTSHPAPPFITSTLQQEGVRKLRLSSRQVMQTAQKLYEGGYITYMRTDSVSLSAEAIRAARETIDNLFGGDYLPAKPRQYRTKVKNAQEAHEAIRPAGSVFRTPESLHGELSGLEWKLYELIWKRTIASQMASAKLLMTTAKITDGHAVFEARGKAIEFPGFLKVYVAGRDDPETGRDDRETLLPKMTAGQKVECNSLTPKKHLTKPAPRFTEATLVKELESRGIGRPSTYATIMDLIQKRGYAHKMNGALVPTFTAYAVVQFLEKYFNDLVDLQFTARLEDLLDNISRAELDASEFLEKFYFGDEEHPGLKAELEQEYDRTLSREIMKIADAEGNTVSLKIGRYGLYLQNNGENVTIPEDYVPSQLKPDVVSELFRQKRTEPETVGVFPENNEPIHLIKGRYGYYLRAGDKMKSLMPGMSPEEVTPELAVKLLSLPVTLGSMDGNPILADLGRYGPYIRCGKETRKVTPPDNLLELTKERALELLKNPAKKSGPQTLKSLGADGQTGNTIELKDGRYGMYVTDGKINATLPKTLSPDEITLETALQLIAEKRAKGPAKRQFKRKK